MHRILIVEDEASLREHLAEILSAEGFSVTSVATLDELKTFISVPQEPVELVLLDRLLNGKDAASLVGQLKEKIVGSRVMILSAINTPSEKAALLDLGADDYLAKPFSGEELVARLRALLRRNTATLRFGNLVLHLEDRKIFIGDNEVQLTNKEFLFLKTLVQSPGKVFPKEYLYGKVWEMRPDVESNVVETTVNKLRRRFEDLHASVEIKNARNVGYWIEE